MTKIILVLSNKGGVGKTTVAVNLAAILSEKYRTGILDVDIHGPNVPKMLGIEGKNVEVEGDKMVPVKVGENLWTMSIGFVIDDDSKPIIWRGPLKVKLLNQFRADVAWPQLDYLVIDLPPGTGDETISVMQMFRENSVAVIVSMPSSVALLDVKKVVRMAKEFGIPVKGIIENMAGEVFGFGIVEEFAKDVDITFLGRIELSRKIAAAADAGKPFVLDGNSKAKESFTKIAEKIVE
ncbi:MAG: Mrp/NBP35 family ATP-binding protein [Candidatus Micrarchaeota archaeon]|nr:Mrp/NBP35 family ATP-binding protein [Candidatus Micrarchaeota archaeon]